MDCVAHEHCKFRWKIYLASGQQIRVWYDEGFSVRQVLSLKKRQVFNMQQKSPLSIDVSKVFDSNPGFSLLERLGLWRPHQLSHLRSRLSVRRELVRFHQLKDFVLKEKALRCSRCFKLHAHFCWNKLFCAAAGQVCVKFHKPRRC